MRSPEGCPWDREQGFESLRPFLVEEAYEAAAVAESLDTNPARAADFCDELGDVLLQVFLNSQVAKERNLFWVADVFDAITTKMIRRHPHVFDKESSKARTVDEVLSQWVQIKATEGRDASAHDPSLLDRAAKKASLPTLSYACEVSKRSLAIGFSWNELAGIFRDLRSEVQEFEDEVFAPSPDFGRIADEAGDIVYALANVVTFLRQRVKGAEVLDLDLAVRGSIGKFLARFREMESILKEQGNPLLNEDAARDLSLERWNELWGAAKRRLAKAPLP